MNFKFTKVKTITSIVLGLLVGFYFGFRIICADCINTIYLLGGVYSFTGITEWMRFIGLFIITFFVIYLIWSLIQKRNK
jgi:hypothetical protein